MLKGTLHTGNKDDKGENYYFAVYTHLTGISIKRLSIECSKTKTKVVTLINHNKLGKTGASARARGETPPRLALLSLARLVADRLRICSPARLSREGLLAVYESIRTQSKLTCSH